METARPTGGLPAVRNVNSAAPLRWLAGGWEDLQKTAVPSLTYGLLLALASAALIAALYVSSGAIWALILSCGFVFAAPMMAMGLYEAGRLVEIGQRPTVSGMLFVRRAFRGDLAYLGLSLLMVYFLWGEIGRVIYGLSTRRLHTTAAEFFDFALASPDGHSMLITGGIIGGAIAYLAFCLVVISAPMLLDRRSDFFTASITSVRAVIRNPVPMALWAVIIAVLTSAAIATACIGLIVILPWLGLASWRAYRDLVPEPYPHPMPGL